MHSAALLSWKSCVWGAGKAPFLTTLFSTGPCVFTHKQNHYPIVLRGLSQSLHNFCTQILCKNKAFLTDMAVVFPHNTQALLLLLLINKKKSVVKTVADKSWMVLDNTCIEGATR